MHTSLSPHQARKLALIAQRIHRPQQFGAGKPATLKAIEHLGYIQIDTISVVERAHHHTLWNRVKNYQQRHLDELQQSQDIFEYWSHAAAYLPMRDFRFSLPRKQAIASGEKHWYDKDPKLSREVLRRIEAEGPLQSRDFEHVRRGPNQWWEWKPAKRALEQLFMEGELMIVRREGFQKVYDITERALSHKVHTSTPSEEELQDHRIFSYLRAHGLATAAQIGYLLKGQRARLHERCLELVEDQKLLSIRVKNADYFTSMDAEQRLQQPLSRSKVKILSPFDNLVIQRNRVLELFDFDYQIECYVPAAKRCFGYFCLPLLWGQKLVGRLDAKMDRRSGILQINSLHREVVVDKRFEIALCAALQDFLQFNQGHQISHL